MALRAVSIVGLESSIRSEFDRRIDRVQQSLREHHHRQINSRRASNVPSDGQQEQIEENEGHEENSASENSNDESQNNTNANNSTGNEPPSTTPEDMQQSGDLGRIATLELSPSDIASEEPTDPGQAATTGTRANSVDIRVEYEAFPEVTAPSENGDSIEETIEREIRGLRRDNSNDRSMSCCKFYRAHWVGHLVTGIMSGCLFVLLGIIFLVNENRTIPIYAGIILIVLGLAPCCMALNRYRYARLYERERRRALRRLGALRRAHRRNAREERRRQRQAYSDLPPAYDNLGFDLGEDDPELDGISFGTSSSQGSFVLPTYDQCVKKQGQPPRKESTIERISNEIPAPDSFENINNNNREHPAHFQAPETARNSDEVVVVVEPPVVVNGHIEMVESHFETDTDRPASEEPHSSGIDDNQAERGTPFHGEENGEFSDA